MLNSSPLSFIKRMEHFVRHVHALDIAKNNSHNDKLLLSFVIFFNVF